MSESVNEEKGKTHTHIGRVVNLLEVGTEFHPELTGRANIYVSMSIYRMSVN